MNKIPENPIKQLKAKYANDSQSSMKNNQSQKDIN